MLNKDADYFAELQTQTGWGKTLQGFAEWCAAQPGWLSLDVGCGPGLLPGIFAHLGCKAVGVDLDLKMFHPAPLYPLVVAADVFALPFASRTFDLVTATNLLFLLADPILALREMKRMLRPGGKAAMLNPSENISEQAVVVFVKERGLQGVARETMINWARRAEGNHRWTESETRALYESVEMRCEASILKVGTGFARFSWGRP